MDYPYHDVDKTIAKQAQARLPAISRHFPRFYLQIEPDKFVHSNNDKGIANGTNLLKRIAQ